MDSALTRQNPELLLAHADFVRALAAKLVFDESAAQDVVQETWVSALQHPPRADRPLRAWLSRVTVNHALQLRRGERRRVAREEQSARVDGVPSAADIVEREAARKAVVEVVLALDEPYRSTILLRFYEDLPPREVAKRLRIPVETVRTRTKRGLALLRSKLDQRYGDDREAWMAALLPLLLLRPMPWWRTATSQWLAGAVAVTGLAALAWWISPTPQPDAAPAVARAEIAAPDLPRPKDDAESRLVVPLPAPGSAEATELASARCAARGLTVDEKGAPVAGASVVVYAALEPEQGIDEPIAETTSDAEGRFAFEGLPRTYFLNAYDERGRVAVAGLAATFDHATAVDDVVLQLAPSLSVAGRVVDLERRPLAGSAWGAFWWGGRGQGRATKRAEASYRAQLGFTTVTDAEGRFALQGLPAVRHTVSASHSGFLSNSLGVVASGSDIEIVLEPGEDDFGNGARAGPYLSGKREGASEPIAPLSVRVLDRRTRRPVTSCVISIGRQGKFDARELSSDVGRYEVPGVAATPVTMTVRADGYAPWFMILREAPPAGGLDIDLCAERELDLRVVDSRGEPVANARLVITGERGQPVPTRISDRHWNGTVVVAPDGSAHLAGLPAATLNIEVRVPDVVALAPFEFDLRERPEGVRELRLPCDLSSPRHELLVELALGTFEGDFEVIVRAEGGETVASALLSREQGECQVLRPLRYLVQRYSSGGALELTSQRMLPSDSLVGDHGPRVEPGPVALLHLNVPESAREIVVRGEKLGELSGTLEPEQTRVVIGTAQR